jgi:hypothetical protein
LPFVLADQIEKLFTARMHGNAYLVKRPQSGLHTKIYSLNRQVTLLYCINSGESNTWLRDYYINRNFNLEARDIMSECGVYKV